MVTNTKQRARKHETSILQLGASLTVVVLGLTATGASADGYRVRAGYAVPPIANWTGFYIGRQSLGMVAERQIRSIVSRCRSKPHPAWPWSYETPRYSGNGP